MKLLSTKLLIINLIFYSVRFMDNEFSKLSSTQVLYGEQAKN